MPTIQTMTVHVNAAVAGFSLLFRRMKAIVGMRNDQRPRGNSTLSKYCCGSASSVPRIKQGLRPEIKAAKTQTVPQDMCCLLLRFPKWRLESSPLFSVAEWRIPACTFAGKGDELSRRAMSCKNRHLETQHCKGRIVLSGIAHSSHSLSRAFLQYETESQGNGPTKPATRHAQIVFHLQPSLKKALPARILNVMCPSLDEGGEHAQLATDHGCSGMLTNR